MPTLHATPTCPICRVEGKLLAHGVVAPFISLLTGLPLGQAAGYRRCPSCTLDFFDARYGEDELPAIYSNYRGARYSKIRRSWEPWYGQQINSAYSQESESLDERRAFMDQLLHRSGLPKALATVVDYGGDEGQFFPNVPTARRVVCDVSDRPLRSGVERISSLGDLGETKADLVIIAHVLEHLPDPISPLLEIRQIISEDGLLYVETPLDSLKVQNFQSSERYRHYLQVLVRHRYLFIPVDLVSGLFRQYRAKVPRLGVIKESEHINYFTDDSMRRLLDQAGFSVVAWESDQSARVGRLRIGRHGVVARPTSGWAT